MATVRQALVVGAGMAGLTQCLALKRVGIACDIVEIRPALTEPGTGISLQGPALRALREVGVLDGCNSRGFAQTFFKTCDAEGNVTGTVELPRLLGPNYPGTIGIMRHAVHEVLAAELSRVSVPIRLGTTVSALTQDDDGVDVTFTDGTRERYTGQMNWRATVSRPPEVTGRFSYFFRSDDQIGLQSGFQAGDVHLPLAKYARAPALAGP